MLLLYSIGIHYLTHTHRQIHTQNALFSSIRLFKCFILRTKLLEVMEFQLSYFKSWNMMLWKCCTQYVSKFGKLRSGHRTGKGQFSFQSQRKAMPKNAQTTTQLHSSHMLVQRRQWHPTPVFLPGKIPWMEEPGGLQSMGSLKVGHDWAGLHFHFSLSCIGEGNGNPLQCSRLENPRDGGAWWAAIYGVAQSRTRLKWLSSSSSSTR